MASQMGWDQGPYGPGIGPQGNAGLAANDNFLNAGMVNGNAFDGGMPNIKQPNPAPQATPDQNQPGSQPMSQPGSGASTTTPEGAVNQINQNQGR
jgi:hypothetical protein